MLISFFESATENQIDSVLQHIKSLHIKSQFIENSKSKTLLILNSNGIGITEFKQMQGIKSVKDISVPYKLASRQVHSNDTIITFSNESIGNKEFSIIAGPCSVENEKQIFQIAEFLVKNNIKLLRGGAFKPRTSPYSFQGLEPRNVVKRVTTTAKAIIAPNASKITTKASTGSGNFFCSSILVLIFLVYCILKHFYFKL